MDALKNLANKAGSGSTGNTAPAAGGAQAGQKEDYLDKGKPILPYPRSLPPKKTNKSGHSAFDMGAKKAGHPMDRNTSEKITDGAREAFEKATGKTVNSKISN